MERFFIFLKLLYRKNKSIFIILLIIQCLLASSVNYILLKSHAAKYDADMYNHNLRTFVVVFHEPVSSDNCEISVDDLSESIKAVEFYNETYNIKAYSVGEDVMFQNVSGHFSINMSYDWWKNTKGILLSVENLYKNQPMDTFQIEGCIFDVLGVCDQYLEKESIIPIHTFLEVGLPINKILITTSNDISLSDMETLHSKIQYLFPSAEIEDPIKRNYAFEEALKDTDILSLVTLLLAMLTEGYLMLYLRQKCNREYEIIKVLGSTSLSNTILHAVSSAVALLLQSFIGSILFNCVILQLIGKVDRLLLLTFDIRTLLYAQLTIVAFVFFTCLPAAMYKGVIQ